MRAVKFVSVVTRSVVNMSIVVVIFGISAIIIALKIGASLEDFGCAIEIGCNTIGIIALFVFIILLLSTVE